jgi:hypothetical protein
MHTNIIDAVRTATSPVAPTVSDQHVISRVLLRRWTEQGKPGAGRQLMRYDVIRGATRLRSVAQLGYVLDFVKIDSLAIEKVWQRVENHQILGQKGLPADAVVTFAESMLTLDWEE